MAPQKNLALIFSKVPTGMPVPGEHLTVHDIGFDASAALPANHLRLEHLYASFDPYMRGRMRDASIKTYFPAFELNSPVANGTIARVLASTSAQYSSGDLIQAFLPIQQFSTVPDTQRALKKLFPSTGPPDLRDYLGALGLPGLTAYSSLYEIGKPKKGETIFISSAAGAVGAIVGQIAKHEGLRVIGSVGSQSKLDFIIDSLGFDCGFNYKTEKPVDALKRLCPDGIDIYYENVGGEQLEAALECMNDFGRIPASGMISQYSLPDEEKWGIKGMMQIVIKRLTLRGFIVSDPEFGGKWGDEFRERMTGWLREGTFKAKTSETVGMEGAAEGFVGMLRGENFGKAVLKIKV